MQQIRMRRLAYPMVGGLVLAAGIVGAAAIAPDHRAEADSAGATLKATEARAILTEFASKQTAADQLPPFLREGEQALDGLDFTSSRFLGATDGTRAWTALNSNAEVCLVTLLAGSEQWASSTCATPADFAAHGIGLQSATSDESARLYFVPEGYGADADAGLEEVAPQLLEGDPTESQEAPVELPQEDDSARDQRAKSTQSRATLELLPFDSITELQE
ncbi:hypothetical protein [Curtobacterium flaccumfaciens]|uniref:hypothetical protein n=1 Tax=Curtobacterium flaccumfaciens TaxID=2035 RepID=UPI00105EBBFC|nr:hypothetical protein [Curtobacterium flaccumfaciens]